MEVRKLGLDLIEDFYAIHNKKNQAGWCFCSAWWTPSWEGWGQRSAEENKSVREKLFDQKIWDGFLLYQADNPIGWCQCGPRDQWPKLCRNYDLSPDPKTWAITCLFIIPPARRKGYSVVFLTEILRQIRKSGVGRVQAFPRRGDDLPSGDVWTGPEGLYRKLGFIIVRQDQNFTIYEKEIAP